MDCLVWCGMRPQGHHHPHLPCHNRVKPLLRLFLSFFWLKQSAHQTYWPLSFLHGPVSFLLQIRPISRNMNFHSWMNLTYCVFLTSYASFDIEYHSMSNDLGVKRSVEISGNPLIDPLLSKYCLNEIIEEPIHSLLKSKAL